MADVAANPTAGPPPAPPAPQTPSKVNAGPPPSQTPSKASAAPPVEGSEAGAPTDAPPVEGEGGDGDVVVTASKLSTATKTESKMRMMNDQKDFYICIGMIAIIAIACTIGVVIMHFMLADGLFAGQEGHYTGSSDSNDSSVVATTAGSVTVPGMASTTVVPPTGATAPAPAPVASTPVAAGR